MGGNTALGGNRAVGGRGKSGGGGQQGGDVSASKNRPSQHKYKSSKQFELKQN